MKKLNLVSTLLSITFSITLVGCDSTFSMTNEEVIKAIKVCEEANMQPVQLFNGVDQTRAIRCDIIPKEQPCAATKREEE